MTTNQNRVTMADGYWIERSAVLPAVVRWGKAGKEFSSHAGNFKTVEAGTPAAAAVLKNGGRLEDYRTTGDKLVRWNETTRPVIEAALEFARVEKIERDAAELARKAALEIEKTDARAKCTLPDPVEVHLDYFDGAPWAADYDGLKIDLAQVETIGRFSFTASETIKALRTEKEAVAAKAAEAKAAKEAKAKAYFDAKLAEAKTTGKAVALDRWTTDRCMCGHGNECSFDRATEWLSPDGSRKITYTCCY